MTMSNCEEDRSVFNAHLELEVLIDRPVVQVWKQFLDIGAWVTSHDIENVYGAPGTLGSITRVSFKKAKEQGYPPAHHHYCKIIALVSERQYLLKTYSERGGSYGLQLAAFDDARFFAIDGKTRVTFTFYGEYRGEAVMKDPASMNRSVDVSREGMLKNLENLKQMVESR
jgi:hypothetical protein